MNPVSSFGRRHSFLDSQPTSGGFSSLVDSPQTVYVPLCNSTLLCHAATGNRQRSGLKQV